MANRTEALLHSLGPATQTRPFESQARLQDSSYTPRAPGCPSDASLDLLCPNSRKFKEMDNTIRHPDCHSKCDITNTESPRQGSWPQALSHIIFRQTNCLSPLEPTHKLSSSLSETFCKQLFSKLVLKLQRGILKLKPVRYC